MAQIAKELDNRKEGDRQACPICNPRLKRVRMDRLWSWSLQHPAERPFRPFGEFRATLPTSTTTSSNLP